MSLHELAGELRAHAGLAAKRDVAAVSALLGAQAPGLGDDCAAIPDGEDHLLFAIEGFIAQFVEADPWFAGWCGVMVNLSDIAAMGGRAIAVADAIWAKGEKGAESVLAGMAAAARAYGVQVAGGHSNFRSAQGQLAVSVMGRAKKLLSSFAAKPGELLIAAIDLRGAYRPVFDNFQAALDAPPERLRGDLELLPEIAEAGLSGAAKDISQAGLVGTAAMFAECSGVGMRINPHLVPRPEGVTLARWLKSFPSYGYLLTATPEDAPALLARFAGRGIGAAVIGAVEAHQKILLDDGASCEEIWDFAAQALMGCAA
ncbi:sll0787 family AIR synthase-like protein [Acidocella sp. MX-AZ02]|uniref:sll0787 family AIR synthase-like protein n=1 Tax=Acidocella sp. MX-AZ02 TaxID=1214225 RepID=UPI00028D7001|nr:sll0787 family AIR synthase-like protein [Acidocella sp. MX-AZ02]EKM98527.1 selenophosphate synthetase-related protein [Acidocella sp. MX-AZ02]